MEAWPADCMNARARDLARLAAAEQDRAQQQLGALEAVVGQYSAYERLQNGTVTEGAPDGVKPPTRNTWCSGTPWPCVTSHIRCGGEHPPNSTMGETLCEACRRRHGRDAKGQKQHLCEQRDSCPTPTKTPFPSGLGPAMSTAHTRRTYSPCVATSPAHPKDLGGALAQGRTTPPTKPHGCAGGTSGCVCHFTNAVTCALPSARPVQRIPMALPLPGWTSFGSYHSIADRPVLIVCCRTNEECPLGMGKIGLRGGRGGHSSSPKKGGGLGKGLL